MKPDRKKEKLVCYHTVPLPNVRTSNGTVMAGVSTSSAKQEKPSYNAVPPPPNLYGSPQPSLSSEKVKGTSPGIVSDGEKKGRRRPGRKSRQVADSSAFPVSDTLLPSGTSEGIDTVGQLRQELCKVPSSIPQIASSCPSPSPSSMPNPSFKMRGVQDLLASSSAAKFTSQVDSNNVETVNSDLIPLKLSQSEQRDNVKGFAVLVSSTINAAEGLDSGGVPKSKPKESPPIGIPKLKGKEASKNVKTQAGTCTKRSASLVLESRQGYQKGWRMCTPYGTTSTNCSGSSDTSASTGNSGQTAERTGVVSTSNRSSDGGLLQNPHSWPGSSVLGSPGRNWSGSVNKLSNGVSNSSTFGYSVARSSHFSEHLSMEDSAEAIEAGHIFRGVMRVNSHYRSEAYVTLEGVPVDILIDGLCAQNRGMEGDIVAVQLNPTSQWPRLKGSNNKQSGSLGAEDVVAKIGNQTDDQVSNETSKFLNDQDQQLACGDAGAVCTEWQKSGSNANVSRASTEDVGGRSVCSGPPGNLQNRSTVRPLNVGKGYGKQNIIAFSSSMEANGKQSSKNSNIFQSKLHEPSRPEPVAMEESMQTGGEVMASPMSIAAIVTSMPSKRPTGRVVAILGKSMRRESVIGFLEGQSNVGGWRGTSSGNEATPQKAGKKFSGRIGGAMITFVPVDNRFPKMAVSSSGLPDHLSKRLKESDPTLSSELVVARVEEWRADEALPRASIKQSLGPGGTIEAQTAAILFENGIHSADFPPSSLACLPKVPWKIPGKELNIRKDLRGVRIFTIDPPTAKDLDDALSVEHLDGGITRVGVHIADVSFFVEPDSALDKEAQNRSTSVYLIQRVLPMLPPLLCEELCSLNPGVDRLAFSVIWNMDSSGNILDQWIGRTIICSCAKLTYGHAQEMIDGSFTMMPDEKGESLDPGGGLPLLYGEHSWTDVVDDVRTLHDIAKRRRESRFDGGALKLENSKLVFSLDDDGEPCDSMMCQHQDSNFLVEEFMLLANMTVARVISGAFPERALLRRHPEPSVRKLKEFEEFCTKNGFHLDTSSSGALHLSLQSMRESFHDDPVLFNILMLYATKPMQLAKYFCTGELKGREDDWGHYALAVRLYTHFTSPIRRYPDLVVHRTLAAALEAENVLVKDRLVVCKGHYGSAGTGRRCFTGPKVDKEVTDSHAVQEALVVAAERHKIPEVSELSMVAAHCNERRLACRNVKEASDKLYLWSVIKKKQGVLSNARVLALGPKFMSLYVCKIAMERRIYYDEIEGLSAEWFEATGTLVLNLSSEKVAHKKSGLARGRPQRTVADVALLVNPTDSISSSLEQETYEDLIREVEERLAGKIITDEDDSVSTEKEDQGKGAEVEPAVLPLTLRWFSSVPVSIHAMGGDCRPLDIAVRLYVSSYAT